jgi:hypothetical protein
MLGSTEDAGSEIIRRKLFTESSVAIFFQLGIDIDLDRFNIIAT